MPSFAPGPRRCNSSPATAARRLRFNLASRLNPALPCLLAALALWPLAAEPAQAALSWGISGGVTPLLVGQPNELARMGPASSLRLHWEDERQFDASIGWLHRAFRLSQDGRHALGTHGIAVENGINFGWYRLGTSAELAWLQRFTPEAALQHDWGIVVETFVAMTLPGGEDEKSKWELSLHLPALQNKPDTLIQSRLMLTLWLK